MDTIMKQRKLVFFYSLTLFTLLFFTLYLAGVINIKLPTLKILESSPDATATKLSVLCDLKKYEAVATRCVRQDNDKYLRITSGDILESDLMGGSGYIGSANGLCNMLVINRKVEKSKISADVWEYKYFTNVLAGSGRIYKIVFFDNDWRFVLAK